MDKPRIIENRKQLEFHEVRNMQVAKEKRDMIIYGGFVIPPLYVGDTNDIEKSAFTNVLKKFKISKTAEEMDNCMGSSRIEVFYDQEIDIQHTQTQLTGIGEQENMVGRMTTEQIIVEIKKYNYIYCQSVDGLQYSSHLAV